MSSYYEYLKQNEHKFGIQPPNEPDSNKHDPPKTSSSALFDAEFNQADLRKVLREWRLKNGISIEKEITKLGKD